MPFTRQNYIITILHGVTIIGVLLGIWISLEKRITTLEVRHDILYQKLEVTSKKLDTVSDNQIRVLSVVESIQSNRK